MAKMSLKRQDFRNYVAGKWTDSSGGATLLNLNPADTRRIVGTFPAST